MSRNQALMASVTAILFLGCATPHRITMKDGSTIETRGEPEYEKSSGFYRFETRTGEKTRVNKDEVRSITTLE